MHHPRDRITHTTAFVIPVVEHWLEREIAQWVHPMKDRSDDPSHHELHLAPFIYDTVAGPFRPDDNIQCSPQTEVHHGTTFPILTDKISLPKSMNVYDVIISALMSKRCKIQKWNLQVGWYGTPLTMVQLNCLMWYHIKVYYLTWM